MDMQHEPEILTQKPLYGPASSSTICISHAKIQYGSFQWAISSKTTITNSALVTFLPLLSCTRLNHILVLNYYQKWYIYLCACEPKKTHTKVDVL